MLRTVLRTAWTNGGNGPRVTAFKGTNSTLIPPMLAKITATLKSPIFWIGAVVGLVLAFAYSRFVPGVVKTVASKLPGAQ